jgi:hypothetical protein
LNAPPERIPRRTMVSRRTANCRRRACTLGSRDDALCCALLCALVVLAPQARPAAAISATDRQAVLRGTLEGCKEKIPNVIRQRVGPSAAAGFCSCYANEIANNITQEQVDALAALKARSPTASAIPGYGETMTKAWRVCEKQYLSGKH